jgi:hypothetical protein
MPGFTGPSRLLLFGPACWCPSQANQAKVLTGGGDLREVQFDVPLSVSRSCV